MFVPERNITLLSPSSSSEAQGAPESRTVRTKKETAQSELEEGELRSEDEEEVEEDDVKGDNQNATRIAICAVPDGGGGSEQVAQTYDQNLTKTLNKPPAPHCLPDDTDGNDDDIKQIAGTECLLPPPSSVILKGVKGHLCDLEGPTVQNAECLPSCLDDVTKQSSDSMEAEVAPLPVSNAECGYAENYDDVEVRDLNVIS